MVVLLLTAFAADAEGDRIAEDLISSARERQWNAVERKYVKLVRSHPTVLTGRIHASGAEAARARGDLLRTAQRLSRVPTDEIDSSTGSGLLLLAKSTGLVQIGSAQGALLEPEAFPFQPDLRAAIEHAQSELRTTGMFVGLLPVGDYLLQGRSFQVSPGFEWQVVTEL